MYYYSDSCPSSPSSCYGISNHCELPNVPIIPHPIGIPGPQGIIYISSFYSIMPPDNNATIAGGTAINFNNNGPSNNTDITRLTSSTFNLASIGLYEILFQVSINEAAQLVIVINGVELNYTVVGRATGTNQVIGNSLITTTIPNSILSINNPVGSPTALTITPVAGGSNPVSANIIIKKYV